MKYFFRFALVAMILQLSAIGPAVAAVSQQPLVVQDEATDSLSFTERIQKILDAWDKNSVFAQTHTEIASTNAPQLDSEISQPIVRMEPMEPTYNFDWQGTPLSQSLYAIAKISGKRVVINGQLSGTVYTTLTQVTYDQALDYLGKTFNFNWMLDENGGAILISTSDLMLQSKRFSVHHADKAKVKGELKSLGIDEKYIYVNDEYGSVSVTGTPYQLASAEKRIAEMDKPVAQALIVTQLVEISHGNELNLGLKYTMPTYSHTGNSEGTDTLHGNWLEKLTFSASAEASKALSKGRVVARPMIMAQNGQEATVYMGDRVPILTSTSTSSSTEVTVEYKDIGTNLKVTPFIDEKLGKISMKIDTDNSNIAKWITQGNVSAPQIASRKATTVAHLKSGQSFVIGGLMTKNELDNLSGIPGLMNLPILGNLFKYHSSSKGYTEVFIMVTPFIVTDDIDPKAILRMGGK